MDENQIRSFSTYLSKRNNEICGRCGKRYGEHCTKTGARIHCTKADADAYTRNTFVPTGRYTNSYKKYIPFCMGRPERDTVISDEDILNLRIALNTEDSIESFVNAV